MFPGPSRPRAQRVIAIAPGHEGLNDHDWPCDDCVLALASSSTLDRLMFAPFLEAHVVAPEKIVLDLDAIGCPLQGAQERCRFCAYYDCHCYLPLEITCGDMENRGSSSTCLPTGPRRRPCGPTSLGSACAGSGCPCPRSIRAKTGHGEAVPEACAGDKPPADASPFSSSGRPFPGRQNAASRAPVPAVTDERPQAPLRFNAWRCNRGISERSGSSSNSQDGRGISRSCVRPWNSVRH